MTGAGARIIRPLIRALGEAGAKVYCADINIDAAHAVSEALLAIGIDAAAVQVDQRDEQSIFRMRDHILAQSTGIDILVNAAVGRTMNTWEDDSSAFRKSMEINAEGLFMMTRAVGNVMKMQKSGSIINIASIHGLIGPDRTLYQGLGFDGFVPDYFFHKGGMINFTRFVASYYGPHNVRCNCISPGGIRSESTSEEFAGRYSQRTMLGRMGIPSDLMGVAVFLASDASLYITGSNIIVDGGYTAL